MRLGRGSVVVVGLDPASGQEPRGVRPCIVVSDSDVVADRRFPLVCVVPVTGTSATGLLYPRLAPGRCGLTKVSYVLVDQLRSVDKRRIRAAYVELAGEEMAAIDRGCRCSWDWAEDPH